MSKKIFFIIGYFYHLLVSIIIIWYCHELGLVSSLQYSTEQHKAFVEHQQNFGLNLLENIHLSSSMSVKQVVNCLDLTV